MLAAAVTAGLLAGSSAASAAPGDPGTDIGGAATGSAPTVDNTRWPAELNWVIPGTPEFTDRYLSGRTAGGEPAPPGAPRPRAATPGPTPGTSSPTGRDPGRAGHRDRAAGDGLGDAPIRTAPWPGLATDRGTTVGQDAGGGEVSATPGTLIPMPDSGGAVDNGVGICADTLRRFGTPAANTPFGFGFYQAPDQGSIDFLMQQLAAQPTPAPSGGASFVNPARYYQRGSGSGVDAWDFSPLDVTGYCADENNPFCLTAAFLRCPAGDGQTDAEAAAITACRTWNANVIILNQYIAMTLMTPGVGVRRGRRPGSPARRSRPRAGRRRWIVDRFGRGRRDAHRVGEDVLRHLGRRGVDRRPDRGRHARLVDRGRGHRRGRLVESQGMFGAVSCARTCRNAWRRPGRTAC